ncbi:MAG: ABC transporter substrate-binding protein [Proteobacteria bacterium]|nr:ABC transporter substrate-binding protein [Pseudomonadota bacterium]
MRARQWTSVAVGMILALGASTASAEISDGVVKIGVMNDMSGTYSDLAGPGSVVAAQMAVEDFGGKVLGKPIEIVNADHQNKPDIAANKAREWFDADKVDAIVDLPTSSCALAVEGVAQQKNRVTLVSTGASTKITNDACSPTNVHWTYDTYALAVGTGRAVVANGGDTWFFLTADYAFGHSLEEDTATVVKASGGKVLGEVRHPFPNADFSSFLLQAQASGAKIIGLANAGADTTNAIKQAKEFGITPKQTLAGLLVFITDVRSLGLETAQGMMLTTGFYWDRNDETRAWSKRFYERHKAQPTMAQAGVYSAVMHYLKAIEKAGTDEALATVNQMKAMPINDMFAKNGKIRVDGRMVHDMYLVQVKAPAESKGEWDYYKIVRTIPGDEAYMPLDKSTCPLVKK